MSDEQPNRAMTDDGDASRTGVIARRAHEVWQQRGCPQGDDLRDWLDAEREIAAATAPPRVTRKSGGRARTKTARVTP